MMMIQGLFPIILYTYSLMLSVTKEPRQLLFRQPPGLRENITNTFFFCYYLFLLRFLTVTVFPAMTPPLIPSNTNQMHLLYASPVFGLLDLLVLF